MSTFHLYVSAQKYTPITRSENLARVMLAVANVPTLYRDTLTGVHTGTGHWQGNREHVVILTFSDVYALSADAVAIARHLACSLSQESVLVVAKVTDTDSGMTFQNGWTVSRKSERERDLGNGYTVRDGMGQRPYAYVPDNRGDYSINFVSDY